MVVYMVVPENIRMYIMVEHELWYGIYGSSIYDVCIVYMVVRTENMDIVCIW